jgi:hypothetical protein
MLSYFVQIQSITDNQTDTKTFSTSQSLDNLRQNKYICTNHGRSGRFPSSLQSSWNNTDQIPQKNTSSQGPFVDFRGPCPVHPMSSHTWGDCFNNPKNKALEGQNSNLHSMEIHSGCGYHYLTRGQGRGYGCGHGSLMFLVLLTHSLPYTFNKRQ